MARTMQVTVAALTAAATAVATSEFGRTPAGTVVPAPPATVNHPNQIGWRYVHLRRAQHWPTERA
ncbi:hypothetical protein BH20ACT4_BH20ACT4_06710 [soil metagenome]